MDRGGLEMLKFIAGIFVGFGVAWICAVIQNEYKLYRDFTINELLKENKKYKKIIAKYQDEYDSGH